MFKLTPASAGVSDKLDKVTFVIAGQYSGANSALRIVASLLDFGYDDGDLRLGKRALNEVFGLISVSCFWDSAFTSAEFKGPATLVGHH